jgi:hypothetical protein
MFSVLIRPFALRPRAVVEAPAPETTARDQDLRRIHDLRLRWQCGKAGRVFAKWTDS